MDNNLLTSGDVYAQATSTVPWSFNAEMAVKTRRDLPGDHAEGYQEAVNWFLKGDDCPNWFKEVLRKFDSANPHSSEMWAAVIQKWMAVRIREIKKAQARLEAKP